MKQAFSLYKQLSKILIVSALFSGCSWVELGQQGALVSAAQPGSVSHCKKVGNIQVKVKDQLIGINRSNKKVITELETLARNEASQIGADTIVAINEPYSGLQNYIAYQCHYK